MHCTRAYSIFYFSFLSDCLFQRRRRDRTSRQRKVYCILCLLSYCFFVRNFNNWKPARIFQMRRRLFLHRDGPECVASFFVHSMCISTPPTRSYIATAQRVLHLLSSFLLLFSLARRISSRLVSYCSELRRSLEFTSARIHGCFRPCDSKSSVKD